MNYKKGELTNALLEINRIATDKIKECAIHETNTIWTQFQQNIIQEISQTGIENFLQSPTIKETMFYAPDKKELAYLQNSELWEMYRQIMLEDEIGNPERLDYYPLSSGNLLHHAYTLAQFLAFVEPGWSIKNISRALEIGGGYGSFCRLLLNLGFTGDYTIYDIDLLSVIQWFFLSSYKVVHSYTSDINIKESDLSLLNLKENSTIYFNHASGIRKENRNFEETNKIDLFIALWSLSEIDINQREYFYQKMQESKFVLIGFQHFFENYNNLSEFRKLIKKDKSKKYLLVKISHIPDNYYLFGKAK